MTSTDIVRVAADMGYATSLSMRATSSAHAKTGYTTYVCLWLHGKLRYLGNATTLAQLSEEELRKAIAYKVRKVEGNVEQSKH